MKGNLDILSPDPDGCARQALKLKLSNTYIA
jgi:hypothetical protein